MTLKLVCISGDGMGAGKTTLADRIGYRTGFAQEMRRELAAKYPAYDWFNPSQEYKASTLVPECGGVSVRQVLIEYGQYRCDVEPTYWARRLTERLSREHLPSSTVAVDDLRKVLEIEYLRRHFSNVTHVHVEWAGATEEPQFQNTELRKIADYVIRRKTPTDSLLDYLR